MGAEDFGGCNFGLLCVEDVEDGRVEEMTPSPEVRDLLGLNISATMEDLG